MCYNEQIFFSLGWFDEEGLHCVDLHAESLQLPIVQFRCPFSDPIERTAAFPI